MWPHRQLRNYLLAGYWGIEGHFSPAVKFLVGCPCSVVALTSCLQEAVIRPGGSLLNGYEVGKGYVGGVYENLEGGMVVDITKIYYMHL